MANLRGPEDDEPETEEPEPDETREGDETPDLWQDLTDWSVW